MGQSVQNLSPCAAGRAEQLAALCRQLSRELGQPVRPRWALDRLLELQLLPPAQYRELSQLLADGEQVGMGDRHSGSRAFSGYWCYKL